MMMMSVLCKTEVNLDSARSLKQQFTVK